jgi:hypothetical protein
VPPARLHRLRALLVIALTIAAAGSARAATPPLVVGIADQKPAMFTDPLFTGLGLRDARIAIAWDALHSGWQRSELDGWMAAAHAAGVRPLVTFDHSRSASERKRKQLPRPEQLAHELRMLRKRYPWVRQFSSWNEANYCARCQTGGKLLADRALSRLLKTDWPRTLEEMENRKAAAKGDTVVLKEEETGK